MYFTQDFESKTPLCKKNLILNPLVPALTYSTEYDLSLEFLILLQSCSSAKPSILWRETSRHQHRKNLLILNGLR